MKKKIPSREHSFFERIGDELELSTDQDENTWAVSFSDIVTILLVFFILLLSFSVINPNKYEIVQKAIKGASFETTNIKQLEKQLKEVIENARIEEFVQIIPDELGLNIEIQNRVMFDSGEANLRSFTQGLLVQMVQQIKNLPQNYKFFIEGHTDDVPINRGTYLSNWHLSTARALSVLNIFTRSGIDDRRLRVEGFADTQPLKKYPLKDKNGRPIIKNREKNRRVVIKVR